MYPAFEEYQRRENIKFMITSAIGAVLLIAAIIIAATVLTTLMPNPQDVYEQAYGECMARETIDANRCHDIAVHQAYGD